MLNVEDTRELFEERAFGHRFLCGISKTNGPFFKVDCPPKAEFILRNEKGDYLDQTLNMMWWGWCEALEQTNKLKVFTAEFDGMHLGGSAVVVAKNAEQALAIVNGSRQAWGIGDEKEPTLEAIQEVTLDSSRCVKFDNGDY